MQIREAEVAVGAPPPPTPSTLSTSTSCQSRPSPCHPSTAHPNAPLGAGLCIFNKFRECSKPAISGGGCSEGGFSAASQTVSPRLFMCEAFAILSVPHRPPPTSSSPSSFPFLFALVPPPPPNSFASRVALPGLASFSSIPLPSFSSSSSRSSLASLSRVLSRRGVNSSLEHGQQDNACLLKTSF